MKKSNSTSPAARKVSEEARLDALQAYQILDNGSEAELDDIARLAAYVCGTPAALVTLIDEQRQWFKARVGFEPTDYSREHSFCQHAMLDAAVYEVPDAQQHPLFANNPLVASDPHIRFYAGAPLVTPEGLPLGTLCVIDTMPRQLSDEQREALSSLARQVMSHFNLRRAGLRLEEERQKLEGVLRLANHAGEELYSSGRAELFIKQEQRLVRILAADIVYLEALGDYVNIHTVRERYTVYSTMKDMDLKLPARDFTRIHRKYIVRLDRILSIEADTVLLDGLRDNNLARSPVQVAIGSSYKADLMRQLNLV